MRATVLDISPRDKIDKRALDFCRISGGGADIRVKMEPGDLELLREYARNGSETAFATLVSRHVNLVYSAGLRQLGSPQLAEEVTQSVFLDLARSAATMKPDTLLTAWLYRVTRRTAIDVARGEIRRRLREQKAVAELENNDTETGWERIAPLLEAAMDTLGEAERNAILLRYFEGRSLREVGVALGSSEDAAQKRVNRALERLRGFLSRHGVTTAGAGLAGILSANAIDAAPAGLAASVAVRVAATVVPQAVAVGALKTLLMTTSQKIVISTMLAVAVGTSVYEAAQAGKLRAGLRAANERQRPLLERATQLQIERDELEKRLRAALARTDELQRGMAEVPKLRGEMARLKAADLAPEAATPAATYVRAIAKRVDLLKQKLAQMPEKKIPEMALVGEEAWVKAAALGKVDSDAGLRLAFREVRNQGKHRFVDLIKEAIKNYAAANNDRLPTDLAQVAPFFKEPIDASVYQRYQLYHPGASLKDLAESDTLLLEKARADEEYDSIFTIGLNMLGVDQTGGGN